MDNLERLQTTPGMWATIYRTTIGHTDVIYAHNDTGWMFRLQWVSPTFSRAYPTYDQAREAAIWRVQDYEFSTQR